ncbi:amidohydrolase [Paenibacillus nanensis]|uniref:Amidohydrolase n=1 Tax=Paenibacillus nanensis TaxID=393251 RepID=A0A3A1URK3_9BACL|nr:M20 family metallopeptidase [Paenibacillus nanensis]RIX49343.1 amidohydrolase [Paenibacillus nanensis]
MKLLVEEKLAEELTAFRRELHAHPELSLEEKETAGRVAERIERMGIPYTRNVGGHGIVAELRSEQDGPTIALRADMDALPIEEETGLPFASKRKGVMHACGHDAHTAMLLGAMELLRREKLAGHVRFIFQAAEEVNAGARAMIEDGALNGVSEIYGLHNLPTLSAGKLATCSGPMMGSVDRIDIQIEGKGAHGAIPNEGHDPIVCASAIVMALQSIVSRELSPFEPAVVTIGSIKAGEANNVIPHYAVMSGTVRTFHPSVQAGMKERIERIVRTVADSYRCKAALQYTMQVPVLVNHEEQTNVVDEAVDEQLGADSRVHAAPTLAGEDFSLYLERVPGCFFWLGSGPEHDAGQAYGLHHPKFTLNEACLPVGAAVLAAIVKRRLGRHGKG